MPRPITYGPAAGTRGRPQVDPDTPASPLPAEGEVATVAPTSAPSSTSQRPSSEHSEEADPASLTLEEARVVQAIRANPAQTQSLLEFLGETQNHPDSANPQRVTTTSPLQLPAPQPQSAGPAPEFFEEEHVNDTQVRPPADLSRSPLDLSRFQRKWYLPHSEENPYRRSPALRVPAVHYSPALALDSISADTNKRLTHISADRAKFLVQNECRTLIPCLSGLFDAIAAAEACCHEQFPTPVELLEQLRTLQQLLSERLDILDRAGKSEAELLAITGALYQSEQHVSQRGSQLGAFLAKQAQIRTVGAAFAQITKDARPPSATDAQRRTTDARRLAARLQNQKSQSSGQQVQRPILQKPDKK